MASVLLVAEHDGTALDPSTAKCVSCAKEIAEGSIDIAVFAADPGPVAAQAACLDGATRVLAVGNPVNRAALAAELAPQVASLAPSYTHVLGPSGTFGKDLMPRVAALLGVGQLSDVMAVEDAYRFKRPTYAGNAVDTVAAAPDRILVATVRAASYPATGSAAAVSIESVTLDLELPRHTRFVGLKAGNRDRPDLQTASRVVSGGRGVGSGERFDLIYELADRLGAAVGASRAAVDAGYVANDMQVGQTGKIIAPDLYIAIGISGAIQHLTGIKDAGTIVAINKDADAPIFEVADIGLVADLFEAVPAIIEAIEALEGQPS